jgi:cell division protein FtsA
MTAAERKRGRWRVSGRLGVFSGRERVFTVIDVGSHKIACAIISLNGKARAKRETRPRAHVLSTSIVSSAGIMAARVVDAGAAEAAIRRAVARAEAQARIIADDIMLAAPFPGLAAQIFETAAPETEEFDTGGRDVIMKEAQDYFAARQRKLLHLFYAPPFFPDAAPANGQINPRDVSGVSVPRRALLPIANCLRRSLLNPAEFIAGPIAAAFAVTSEEERMRGVAVLDLGAETCGIALFLCGIPVFVDVVKGGAARAVAAVSKTFHISKFDAERVCARYGSVLETLEADIDLPIVNGETGEPIVKSSLNRILRSHASALLADVKDRLRAGGYFIQDVEVVLTGGFCSLVGLAEQASALWKTTARVGRPIPFPGLDADPALSALRGACLNVCWHHWRKEIEAARGVAPQVASYTSRISHWLRTGF